MAGEKAPPYPTGSCCVLPRELVAVVLCGSCAAAYLSENSFKDCRVNRIVSFGLLLAVILITGFVFFKVMAGFFLPLFLAALLVVLFYPLHRWILKHVQGRKKIAAFLATTVILLCVLLPLTMILFFAANESRSVIRRLNSAAIDDKIDTVREKLGLELPAQSEFERMDRVLEAIQNQSIAQNMEQQREQLDFDITELRGISIELGEGLNQQGSKLVWQEAADDESTSAESEFIKSKQQISWSSYGRKLREARDMLSQKVWVKIVDVDAQQKQISDARRKFNDAIDAYFQFKAETLGGPFLSWLKELANPNINKQKDYIQKSAGWIRSRMVTFGSATTSFVVRFLFGVAIMAIALFSFFLDGPAMLTALKQMTPLDDEHEDTLIAEFQNVSRAVVMATLLSAVAQGLLSGVGYYFAGVESVVLLMVLTTVLALVPFVGAAAVWLPCSLWLIFIEGHVGSGIFLAIYGLAVISLADNVIKPLILHGQSNLHPLWALLSVLGGVAALGPVGILVGPMIVVFLQTLLKILQREISSMDQKQNHTLDRRVFSEAMRMENYRQSQRRLRKDEAV